MPRFERTGINRFEVFGGFTVMTDNAGRHCMIDTADIPYVERYYWHGSPSGYWRGQVDGDTVLLHRYIMKPSDEMVVDHLNHDKADNRRGNLRVCSQTENCQNRRRKTGVKHERGKWFAEITVSGAAINLGAYESEADATAAREDAERIYFSHLGGDRARKAVEAFVDGRINYRRAENVARMIQREFADKDTSYLCETWGVTEKDFGEFLHRGSGIF